MTSIAARDDRADHELAHDGDADGQRAVEVFEDAATGTPTDVPYRDRLETFFGRPLPAIDAFTGRRELAAIGARGAARRNTVVFADDAPALPLVTHEVAHVLQQERAGETALAARHEVADEHSPAEREAEEAAEAVAMRHVVPFAIHERPESTLHLDRDRGGGSGGGGGGGGGHRGQPPAGGADPRAPGHPPGAPAAPHGHGAPPHGHGAPPHGHGAGHPGGAGHGTPHSGGAPRAGRPAARGRGGYAGPGHAGHGPHHPPVSSPAGDDHATGAPTTTAAAATPPAAGRGVGVPDGLHDHHRAALEQVRAAADAGRAALAARVAAGNQATAAAVHQQQQAVIQAGAAQRTQITSRFAAARADVTGAFQAARGRVDAALADQHAALDGWHTTATAAAQTAFTQRQDRATAFGETYAGRATQAAETAAGDARTRIEGCGTEARRIGNEKAGSAGGDADEVRAQQEAAHQVANETADQITSGLNDLVNSLRGQGPDAAQGFRDRARQAARHPAHPARDGLRPGAHRLPGQATRPDRRGRRQGTRAIAVAARSHRPGDGARKVAHPQELARAAVGRLPRDVLGSWLLGRPPHRHRARLDRARRRRARRTDPRPRRDDPHRSGDRRGVRGGGHDRQQHPQREALVRSPGPQRAARRRARRAGRPRHRRRRARRLDRRDGVLRRPRRDRGGRVRRHGGEQPDQWTAVG